MRPTPFRTLLLALSLALGATTMTAHAQTLASVGALSDGTLLNVSAQAEARRVPDVATISAGVVTQAADGNTAMRQNAEQIINTVIDVSTLGGRGSWRNPPQAQ